MKVSSLNSELVILRKGLKGLQKAFSEVESTVEEGFSDGLEEGFSDGLKQDAEIKTVQDLIEATFDLETNALLMIEASTKIAQENNVMVGSIIDVVA